MTQVLYAHINNKTIKILKSGVQVLPVAILWAQ
jgi:hypothetical protein